MAVRPVTTEESGYKTSPEKRARSRAWYQANKADPEYLRKRREYRRRWYDQNLRSIRWPGRGGPRRKEVSE